MEEVFIMKKILADFVTSNLQFLRSRCIFINKSTKKMIHTIPNMLYTKGRK